MKKTLKYIYVVFGDFSEVALRYNTFIPEVSEEI